MPGAAFLPPNLPPHIPYSRALQQRLYLLAQHLRRARTPSAARCGLDQLQAQLLLNGFAHKRFLLAKLLSLAAAAADLPRAESLFLLSSTPSAPASPTLANLLLRAAAASGAAPSSLLALFSRLVARHVLRPNAFSFSTLFAAIAAAGTRALPHGRALHARALAAGTLASSVGAHVATSLVDVYAAAWQLEDARKVFDEMPARSVAAWNCMLVAYVRCGEVDAALRFFGYEMPRRDAVAWTTMIGGCANAGRAAEAVELFWGMRNARVKDDAVTMVALLTACAELGDLELGRWVHARVDWEGQHQQQRTVLLDNALIHMYVKCGALEDALRMFHQMPRRSTVSWTTMISGLAMHGRAEEALDLFHRMQERPDDATLLAVLRACSHAGRIDDGRRYFESMEGVYGITPKIQHYGCMVDMLCRWRRLHDAFELVDKMPFQPNESLWGALLSGCRREGNLGLAVKVTDKLVELQPERAAGYLVLLSNMYADVGQWEQAQMVRERVAALNAEKPAGSSWVNPNQSSMAIV
ncbi:hypothetical protein PR202_ga15873 [Eleusine coracana subsp. coracana]|uniref:Pentatricopeptide repeat-containing protein n=1 Tax=Eleusine coracana subsp. coracana TaxID=191504 RepID=A0AAV5CK74_ELECO|nr:hypothetical protein QOZ80_6BG0488080 [Eleusine coracana subsp. coracana]GJM98831.1 hypothetical protein PR202_ga15873 [Eleusine coracana subsp. coracana]